MSTLLVVPPGAAAEALSGTIQSIPEVHVVGTLPGCLSATEAMRIGAPSLLVVSGLLPPEEILALIRHPRRDRRVTRVIVLSSSPTLRSRFLDAGAFAVISPWDSVENLRAAVAAAVGQPS